MLALLALLFFANILYGSVAVPLKSVLQILLGSQTENDSVRLIVLESRLLRALGAVIAGAALSVSGLLMQTLFRNPLAGPYILGISSGAGLGVAFLTMDAAVTGFAWMGTHVSVLAAAIANALLVYALIFIISLRVQDVMTLLIAGVLIGSIANACVSILQAYAPASSVKSYILWTFASLDHLQAVDLFYMGLPVIVSLFFVYLFYRPLNALLMGEKYATSIGVNVDKLRIGIVVLSGLLAACVTAFCGPIGFVGIVVPHIARLFLKTYNHGKLIFFSALCGSCMLLVSDLLSRFIPHEGRLPINAITAILGIPVILWLLLGKRKISSSF